VKISNLRSYPFIDRVSLDNGRRIVALDVEGKRRPYRTRDGRFYIRVGSEKREASREELSALLMKRGRCVLKVCLHSEPAFSDIDEAHVWSFLREFEGGAFEEAYAGDYQTTEVLARDLLLATTNGSEPVPTVAGLLLFGRDERVGELLPRASVFATRFSGDSIQSPVIEKVKLSGSLLSLYEGMIRFIGQYCDLHDARPRRLEEQQESPIPARANYHRGVVTEAITNLLASQRSGLARSTESNPHF
jgi:ATP-dependent DNA helicase RecG